MVNNYDAQILRLLAHCWTRGRFTKIWSTGGDGFNSLFAVVVHMLVKILLIIHKCGLGSQRMSQKKNTGI